MMKNSNNYKKQKLGRGKYHTELISKLRSISVLSFIMGLIFTVPLIVATSVTPLVSHGDALSLSLFFAIYDFLFALPLGVITAFVTIVRIIRFRAKYGQVPWNKFYAFCVIGVTLCLLPAMHLLVHILADN